MARWRVVVLVSIVLGLAVACGPRFPAGAVLDVAPAGSGAVLAWPAGVSGGDGGLTSYRIDVDGAAVATIRPTARTCTLSGLAAGPHQVAVTFTDAAGTWSGGADVGRLAATVEAPTPAPAGSAVRCMAPTVDVLHDEGFASGLSASDDGRFVLFWSGSTSGSTLRIHDRVAGTEVVVPGAASGTAALSGDGQVVAFGRPRPAGEVPDPEEREVVTWDRRTGVTTRSPIAGTHHVSSPEVLSDDGRFVAITRWHDGATVAARWDRATGAVVQLATPPERVAAGATDISSDGRHVIASVLDESRPGTAGAILRWDAETGAVEEIPLPETPMPSLVVADDGSSAAFISYGGTQRRVYVWERSTGAATDVGAAVGIVDARSMAMSDDGTRVAFAGISTVEPTLPARVWDRATRTLTVVDHPCGHAEAVAVSGDGAEVFAAATGLRPGAPTPCLVATGWPTGG